MKIHNIFEMAPYINDEDAKYLIVLYHSKHAMEREGYVEIENPFTKYHGKLRLLKKETSKNIIYKIAFDSMDKNGDFVYGVVLHLNLRKFVFTINNELIKRKIQEVSNSNTFYQVSWVNVHSDFANSKLASDLYEFLVNDASIFSDHEQYLGGKGLWKSIARTSDHSVFIFDKDDWIRNNEGKPLRYNGKNLDDSLIWGKSIDYKQKLLCLVKM